MNVVSIISQRSGRKGLLATFSGSGFSPSAGHTLLAALCEECPVVLNATCSNLDWGYIGSDISRFEHTLEMFSQSLLFLLQTPHVTVATVPNDARNVVGSILASACDVRVEFPGFVDKFDERDEAALFFWQSCVPEFSGPKENVSSAEVALQRAKELALETTPLKSRGVRTLNVVQKMLEQEAAVIRSMTKLMKT